MAKARLVLHEKQVEKDGSIMEMKIWDLPSAFSTTVEGKANDFNIGGALAGFGGHFIGGAGLGTFQKTPVEKAIRVAILQAVNELASKTPQTYFRHGTLEANDHESRNRCSGAISPASNPSQSKPVVALSGGHETPRESTKVSLPVGKTSSLLPATVSVKAAAANLRESAGAQSKVVATIKERTKLSVQAEDNGWYYVQTDDQKTGWISKSLTVSAVY